VQLNENNKNDFGSVQAALHWAAAEAVLFGSLLLAR
jgi:cytochrome b561